MNVILTNGDISTLPQEEIEAYKEHARKKYPNDYIDELILTLDGDYVNMEIHKHAKPFDRVRRITGYLVGTLDRFNNGKRAEERDRVKHSVTEEY
jgi:hypothetical protein